MYVSHRCRKALFNFKALTSGKKGVDQETRDSAKREVEAADKIVQEPAMQLTPTILQVPIKIHLPTATKAMPLRLLSASTMSTKASVYPRSSVA